MTQMNNESVRLEQLELKMMELEVIVQQLNDQILKQYRDIEQLRHANSDLERKLATLNEPGQPPSLRDEVPPHY